jgi:hypothetical protein
MVAYDIMELDGEDVRGSPGKMLASGPFWGGHCLIRHIEMAGMR